MIRRLIPRTGMVVIDPVSGQPLPAEGADIDVDTYWMRRLNDGDVVEPKRAKRPRPNTGTGEG